MYEFFDATMYDFHRLDQCGIPSRPALVVPHLSLVYLRFSLIAQHSSLIAPQM